MFEVRQSKNFSEWLSKLKDRAGRGRIVDRIIRLGAGNFGDTKPVGSGIFELRLHFGPGYRIYYCRRTENGPLVILLVGGDKSTQQQDILLARKLADEELDA
jgi:putative addiction module killer protein